MSQAEPLDYAPVATKTPLDPGMGIRLSVMMFLQYADLGRLGADPERVSGRPAGLSTARRNAQQRPDRPDLHDPADRLDHRAVHRGADRRPILRRPAVPGRQPDAGRGDPPGRGPAHRVRRDLHRHAAVQPGLRPDDRDQQLDHVPALAERAVQQDPGLGIHRLDCDRVGVRASSGWRRSGRASARPPWSTASTSPPVSRLSTA